MYTPYYGADWLGSLRLRLPAKNLHVGLVRVFVLPCPLDEIAEVRHVLFNGRWPQVWIVLEDAKQIVNVEQGWGSDGKARSDCAP